MQTIPCNGVPDPFALFYNESSCEVFRHDLRVSAGDFARPISDTISAIIIQLHTDKGWWGDQFLPFPIGNDLHTLDSLDLSVSDKLARAEEMVRDALAPIADQGKVQFTGVSARIIEGVFSIEISAILDGEQFRIVRQ